MSTQLLVFIKCAGILILVGLRHIWGFGATTSSSAALASGWQANVRRKPCSTSLREQAWLAQDGIQGGLGRPQPERQSERCPKLRCTAQQ